MLPQISPMTQIDKTRDKRRAPGTVGLRTVGPWAVDCGPCTVGLWTVDCGPGTKD